MSLWQSLTSFIAILFLTASARHLSFFTKPFRANNKIVCPSLSFHSFQIHSTQMLQMPFSSNNLKKKEDYNKNNKYCKQKWEFLLRAKCPNSGEKTIYPALMHQSYIYVYVMYICAIVLLVKSDSSNHALIRVRLEVSTCR